MIKIKYYVIKMQISKQKNFVNREENISIVSSFGLYEGLNISKKDLTLLRKKVESFEKLYYEKINLNCNRKVKELNKHIFTNNNFSNKYEFDNLITPIDERRKFIMSEINKNLYAFLFSLSSLIYFTKISNYLFKINSIVIFKPIFLLTFCCAPLAITLYDSKINWELFKLEYITKKK